MTILQNPSYFFVKSFKQFIFHSFECYLMKKQYINTVLTQHTESLKYLYIVK
jgi:hypothetical protein